MCRRKLHQASVNNVKETGSSDSINSQKQTCQGDHSENGKFLDVGLDNHI
jgi:hypothetical protein